MPSSELYFQDAAAVIAYNKQHNSPMYMRYMKLKDKVRASRFPGAIPLLKQERGTPTANLYSYLTELNLANLLLSKNVSNLCYERQKGVDVDFEFDDLAISVKNLNVKDYERRRFNATKKLEMQGGGKITLDIKGFSDMEIVVERTALGTFSSMCTEVGHSGICGTDIDQMSSVLKYMAKFERVAVASGVKRVLFFMGNSEDLKLFHMDDAAFWYFDCYPHNHHAIFNNDMSQYQKLFGKNTKLGNIDAIVFMCCPSDILAWQPGCFQDTAGGRGSTRKRITTYTKDPTLRAQLEKIFS